MFFSFYLYIGLSRHALMKSFKSYCDAKAVFHSGRENGKTQQKMPELDCHDQSLFSKSLSLKIHLVSCCLIDFFFLPIINNWKNHLFTGWGREDYLNSPFSPWLQLQNQFRFLLCAFDNSNKVLSEQKAPYITPENKDNKSCRYLVGV